MYFSKASGVHQITATGGRTIKAFLDMDTADGPWTVIQRRTSKDVDFYRNWRDYKNGFGDLLGNFWIGNANLHLLTTTPRILRVELEAGDGTKGYAEYSKFQVANEDQNYRLLVQGFSGNVTDGMAYHNNQSFSTYDSDNDEHPGKCAISEHGAWWYKSCYEIQLNGRYPTEEGFPKKELMSWYRFSDVLTKSKMMIR